MMPYRPTLARAGILQFTFFVIIFFLHQVTVQQNFQAVINFQIVTLCGFVGFVFPAQSGLMLSVLIKPMLQLLYAG
jgi:hypothetical protein